MVAIVGARSTRLLLCTTTGLSLCSFRLIPASTRGEGNSAQAIHTRGWLKSQNGQGLLSSTSGCRPASGPCRERRRGGDSSGARLPAVDRGRLCCLAPGGCGCPGTLRRSALEAGANISQRRSKCALRRERSIPSGDGRAHCIALVRNYGPLGYRLLTRSATRNRFATVRTGRNSLS